MTPPTSIDRRLNHATSFSKDMREAVERQLAGIPPMRAEQYRLIPAHVTEATLFAPLKEAVKEVTK